MTTMTTMTLPYGISQYNRVFPCLAYCKLMNKHINTSMNLAWTCNQTIHFNIKHDSRNLTKLNDDPLEHQYSISIGISISVGPIYPCLFVSGIL